MPRHHVQPRLSGDIANVTHRRHGTVPSSGFSSPRSFVGSYFEAQRGANSLSLRGKTYSSPSFAIESSTNRRKPNPRPGDLITAAREANRHENALALAEAYSVDSGYPMRDDVSPESKEPSEFAAEVIPHEISDATITTQIASPTQPSGTSSEGISISGNCVHSDRLTPLCRCCRAALRHRWTKGEVTKDSHARRNLFPDSMRHEDEKLMRHDDEKDKRGERHDKTLLSAKIHQEDRSPSRQTVLGDDDFESPFEGVQAKPEYWHDYKPRELQGRLETLVENWRMLLANLQWNPDFGGGWFCASGDPEAMALQDTFRDCDNDGDHKLLWGSGELRSFVRRTFWHHDLAEPPLSQQAWCALYRQHERNNREEFDFFYSLAFLCYIGQVLLSLVNGQARPVQVAPQIFIPWVAKQDMCDMHPQLTEEELLELRAQIHEQKDKEGKWEAKEESRRKAAVLEIRAAIDEGRPVVEEKWNGAQGPSGRLRPEQPSPTSHRPLAEPQQQTKAVVPRLQELETQVKKCQDIWCRPAKPVFAKPDWYKDYEDFVAKLQQIAADWDCPPSVVQDRDGTTPQVSIRDRPCIQRSTTIQRIALSVFRDLDSSQKGYLPWEYSEIRHFVNLMFQKRGLPRITLEEETWEQIYREFNPEMKPRLNQVESERFARFINEACVGTSDNGHKLPQQFSRYRTKVLDMLRMWESPADQGMRTRLFKHMSRDQSNSSTLSWKESKIRTFVRRVFDTLGLPIPRPVEDVWHQFYRDVDEDAKYWMKEEEAVRLVRHILERILDFYKISGFQFAC
eukprot:gnl/MRDRNA2_/MRDRNA2_19790_c0_seq1.p1 gnl/MRDRNA2_/MRDRNA2_19790_c0~~gnl/MRDRNA2_/MRDRNA2_19790_c0_seq1.p1  ORF type:complete len:795 (+),score=126.89 gnl/MRDRNA2_/MRDRNA2_19790_c0_seq1:114-2498(+)